MGTARDQNDHPQYAITNSRRPDHLERGKVAVIEKHYFNGPHYRLVSATPAFSELDQLKVTLAPLGFFDYFSLNPFFDEPLLTALDGSKVSIRQNTEIPRSPIAQLTKAPH